MKHKGLYITFEGNEGSGKDTLIRNLKKWLKKLNYKIFLTQEPGGTKIGKQIREILVNKKNLDMGIKTELLLFIANRTQNIYFDVMPKKNQGYLVLSNRGHDSSIVYQGAGRKIDQKDVEWLNNFALDGNFPDYTFILTVEPKIGLARVREDDRGNESKKGDFDRIEKEKLAFHNRVYKGYQNLSETHQRYILMDTTKISPKEVFEKVKKIFIEKIFPQIYIKDS